MLKATEQERQNILSYVSGQAPDEVIKLAQKVYTEWVHSVRHDIWDIHTNRRRWWVITNPANLYSQQQFPNMDLALTFHVGLCLRIPTSERPSLAELQVEPLVACWRTLEEASEALSLAEEVEDLQSIGVRCRESLITLIHMGQGLIQLPNTGDIPKKSDFRAWSVIIADAILPGSSNKERRGLLKTSADGAWRFVNWLTHARQAYLQDAESAINSTELTISLFTAALIRNVRGVPDLCPSCGSQRLYPERGIHSSEPQACYERPVCGKCGWTGTPVIVKPLPPNLAPPPPEGECVIMTVPLLHFRRSKELR
jgi:hypothetical protein